MRISTPMLLPPEAGVEAGGAVISTAGAVEPESSLLPTGWKASGAAGAAGVGDVAGASAAPPVAVVGAGSGAVPLATAKSFATCCMIDGAVIGLGSVREGSPDWAVRTVSGRCMMKSMARSVIL